MRDPRQPSVRLVLAAGLYSAFFVLLWEALKDFVALGPHEQFRELVVITATSIGMLLVIEPILERIGPVRLRESSRQRKDSILVSLGVFLTVAAASLFHGLLHEHINQSISLDGMIVVGRWASSLFAPCVITASWLYAVRQERSQARWYGLIAGAIVGLVAIGLTLAEIYFLYPSSGLGEMSARRAATAMLILTTFILWIAVAIWTVTGYLGGLAIDRQWCSRAWRGIAFGLMIAAVVGSATSLAESLVISLEIRGAKTAASVPGMSWVFVTMFVETAIVNLGWALGLFITPDTDLLLGWGERQHCIGRDVWRELRIGVTSAAAMLALGSLLSLGGLALSAYLTALTALSPVQDSPKIMAPTARATTLP